ncbi:uncharacterized protein N7511_008207 [Penicillium nucicola]|uniref:uncharacterized protein n=1 Tax=Penicillium nucicola TaxID=1850975 RepID=UPI00254526C3|nr:uncharacterized protein N7511_008207 [Penicillium nucicola]KAJ5754054.1 hypothetical protein N7511_008207 [Penicillium nucicola]
MRMLYELQFSEHGEQNGPRPAASALTPITRPNERSPHEADVKTDVATTAFRLTSPQRLPQKPLEESSSAGPSRASPIAVNRTAPSSPITTKAPAPNRLTHENPPASSRAAISLLDVINSVIKAEQCQQEIYRLEKEMPTLERNLQKAKQSQVFAGTITLYQQQLGTAKDELSKQTTLFDQHRSVSSKAEKILLSQWSQPQSQPGINPMSEKMENMESQIQELKTQATRPSSTSSISDDKIKAINHNFSKIRECEASTKILVTNIEGRLKNIEAGVPATKSKSEAPAGTIDIRVQKLEKSIQAHSLRLGNIDFSNAKSNKDFGVDISRLQGQVSRLQSDTSRLQDDVSTVDSVNSKLQRNVSVLERNDSRRDSDLEMVDKKLQDKLTVVNNELKRANNELSGRVFPLERAVTLLKSQPRSTSGGPPSEVAEASSSFTNHRLSLLEQEIQALAASIQLQETRIQGIMSIHENAQDEYFAELEKLKNSIDSLETGHYKSKQVAPELNSAELETLKNSIDSLKNDHEKTRQNVTEIDRRSDGLMASQEGSRAILLQGISKLQTKIDDDRTAYVLAIEALETNVDNLRSSSANSIEGIEQKLESTRSDLTSSVVVVRTDINSCSATVNQLRDDLSEASKRLATMIPAFEEVKKCNDVVTGHTVSLRSLEGRYKNILTGDLVTRMSHAILEMSPLATLEQKVQMHVTETKNKIATLAETMTQLQQVPQLSSVDKHALATVPQIVVKVKSLLQRVDTMQAAIDKLSTLSPDTTDLRLQSQSSLSPEDKNALAECIKVSEDLSKRVDLMESTGLQKLLQEMSRLSNQVAANEELIYSVDAKFDDLNPTEPYAELIQSVEKIDPLIAKVEDHILQLEQVKNNVADFNRAEAARSNAGLQDFTDVHARLSDLESNCPSSEAIQGLLAKVEGFKLRDYMLEHRMAELGSKADGIRDQLADLTTTKNLAEAVRDELDFLAPRVVALENQDQTEDEGIKLTDQQIKQLRERLAGEPIHTMLIRLRKVEDEVKKVLSSSEVRILGASRTSTSTPTQVTKSSVGNHIPTTPAHVHKDGTRPVQLAGTPARSTPKPGLSSGASSSSKSQPSSLKKPPHQQVQSLKGVTGRHSIEAPPENERSTPSSSTGASPEPGSSSLNKKLRKELKAKRKAEREAERETRESREGSSKPKPKKIKTENES